jgi:short-subunit dehydrogenase
VTCLAPGETVTGFNEKAGVGRIALTRMPAMSARTVALAGHRAFRSGKVVEIPGLGNKLGVFAVRLFPRSIVRKFVKRLQSPKENH